MNPRRWACIVNRLRTTGLIWCILCAIGATIGGIWALLHRENDGLYDG